MGDNLPDRGNFRYYQYDLEIQLQTMLQVWEEEREEYWSVAAGEEGKFLYDKAENFAAALWKGAKSLVLELGEHLYDEDIEENRELLLQRIREIRKSLQEFRRRVTKNLPPEVRKAISELPDDYLASAIEEGFQTGNGHSPLLRIIIENLKTRLARLGIEDFKTKIFRLLQLWEFILHQEPKGPGGSYLRMISRCYVEGFDPECIMCCRSVVEDVFGSVVTDSICEQKWGPRPPGEYFTFNNRIRIALEKGLITEDVKNKAERVRIRGNKAIHGDPETTKLVWETVQDTCVVVKALLRAS